MSEYNISEHFLGSNKGFENLVNSLQNPLAVETTAMVAALVGSGGSGSGGGSGGGGCNQAGSHGDNSGSGEW